jgi:hypothetical protein
MLKRQYKIVSSHSGSMFIPTKLSDDVFKMPTECVEIEHYILNVAMLRVEIAHGLSRLKKTFTPSTRHYFLSKQQFYVVQVTIS